jgi:integrase
MAGLPGFRFHDLRHCAITSLAESGASDSTIMAIAGHVSRRHDWTRTSDLFRVKVCGNL